MHDRFKELEQLIAKLPCVTAPVISGTNENGLWWIKFSINIEQSLAWNVVQMLAYTINYLSISERLSTVFYPVSPPPSSDGGPAKSLTWIIESTSQDFMPAELAVWLQSRLPASDNLAAWFVE